MPAVFGAGVETNDNAVLLQFIATVYSGVGVTTNAVYHQGNRPVYSRGTLGPATFPVHVRLGPSPEPVPTPASWPPGVVQNDILTTNMFYLLHQMAVRLTRIRQGRFVVKSGGVQFGNGAPGTDQIFGFATVAYNAGNVVMFNMPAHPAQVMPPPYTATPAQIAAFLEDLRAAVVAVQGDINLGSDFWACHANCHASCHGSRGRR